MKAVHTIACRNALQRLVRCLFAEGIVDRKRLVFASDGRSASVTLERQQTTLVFEELKKNPADIILNRGPIVRLTLDGSRMPVEAPGELIDLLRDELDFRPTDEAIAGLKKDMANSIENDALARCHRETWNADLRDRIGAGSSTGLVDYLRRHVNTRDAAVLLDQWGALEGHPFYPTWKSKPGVPPEKVAAFSPEFHACVPVRIAAIRADMAHVERMPHVGGYNEWFAAAFPALWQQWQQRLDASRLAEKDWHPLPIHAWHLENCVGKEYAQEIANGLLMPDGPDVMTAPSMSFRTMLPLEPQAAPYIKLPVALWLTSEQRSLQAKSIHMGPRNSAVIKAIVAAEGGFGGTFDIFPEEVGLHYRNSFTQDDRPGRLLSVVYRGNAEAFRRTDGLLPIPVAALFTRTPSDGRPLITELIEAGRARTTSGAAEDYFRQYARVVVRPVVGMYLLYGIGLEAHQQNTFVLFSPDGLPRSVLVRDFGDGRTFGPLLAERGYDLKPYVYPGILPTVFDDDIAPVRSFVIDACFVCHLHEMAMLLTEEYQLAPTRLWAVLREETERAFDAQAPRLRSRSLWQAERSAFLDQPWPTRSVLRMHLQRYADYRLQHYLPNPLTQIGA
jgi:siderophore synthetase component